jgi:multicomponent Na+:H+ antiporter subunit B
MSEFPQTIRHDEGMSLIVKTVTRWTKGFILLFGIYIIVYGHLSPGGGFPGGVIVACSFILLMLAEGERVALRIFSRGWASELDSVGALIFLGAGIFGFLVAGMFFENFIPTDALAHFKLFSSGIIPVSNIGIGIKVAASLFLAFAVLSAFRVARGKESLKATEQEGQS